MPTSSPILQCTVADRATSPARQEPEGSPYAGRRVTLCGVPLHALTMSETVAAIDARRRDRIRTFVSVVNVAKLVNMQSDAQLRDSVLSGDLILADGMPLVWLSKLLGDPLPERVAGIDLMFRLFRLADECALRVYFLGARHATLQRIVDIAARDYPSMAIAGWRDGYFTEPEEERVARCIRDARADILLVAMSSPKKELFMRRFGTLMSIPIVHGVGGSLDVMAGETTRAPRWMQCCGLEWAYRVVQEPKRMWKRYLLTNTKFIRLAAGELWRSRRRRRPPTRPGP